MPGDAPTRDADPVEEGDLGNNSPPTKEQEAQEGVEPAPGTYQPPDPED